MLIDQSTAQDTWDLLSCEEDEHGTRRWLDHNVDLHREDGPAIVYKDGTQYWMHHGELHRIDGPAVIKPRWTLLWFQNGIPHRSNGPSAIWYDGSLQYSLNGVRVGARSFCEQYEKSENCDPEILLVLKTHIGSQFGQHSKYRHAHYAIACLPTLGRSLMSGHGVLQSFTAYRQRIERLRAVDRETFPFESLT